MDQYHPKKRCSLLEPALYQITILGTLDKHRSDYYGSLAKAYSAHAE